MIVLDASVLIAHLDRDDGHHARAVQLLREVASEALSASVITLAEVLVGPARRGALERAREVVDALGVAPVALADDAPARLALLRADTSLRLPDCCVLLAAESLQAGVATFDLRLAAVGSKRGHLILS